MKNLLFVFVLFCFISQQLFGQNQNNIWYLGDSTGIDFNTSPPSQLNNGRLKVINGGSSICDKDGNLLLYTDGTSLVNGKHEIILDSLYLATSYYPNNSVIIPHPGDTNQFYIFTTKDMYFESIRSRCFYSLVDLSLNNGSGGMIYVRRELSVIIENLTVALHNNCIDYWLLTHEDGSDIFNVFLVDENGLNTSPITYSVNPIYINWRYHWAGQMKVSPNGEKLAIAANLIVNNRQILLYDFNNETGIISNPLRINSNTSLSHTGIEFSPNSSFLYASQMGSMTQYDISSNDVDRIRESMTYIHQNSENDTGFFLEQQLAPDGRIYGVYRDGSLTVINNPNQKGIECDFQIYSRINLNPDFYATPNFCQSFLAKSMSLPDTLSLCIGSSFELSPNVIYEDADYIWILPNGDSLNQTSIQYPECSFAHEGLYRLIVSYEQCNDDVYDEYTTEVIIYKIPEAEIISTDNTLYCKDEELTLMSMHYVGFSYEWSTGETTQSIKVNEEGEYWLIVENIGGCRDTAYIEIFRTEPLEAEILSDNGNSLCPRDSIILNAKPYHEDFKYKWNTLEHSNSIVVYEPGVYSVIIIDTNLCIDSAEIVINLEPDAKPMIDIIGNNPLCYGESIVLFISEKYVDYEWSTGEKENEIEVSDPGVYSVTVTDTNGCCGTTDITINRYPEVIPKIEIIGTNPLCNGETAILRTVDKYEAYKWSTGDSTSSIEISEASKYWVTVKDSNGCEASVEIEIYEYPELIPEIEIIGNNPFCEGDSATLKTKNKYESYEWSTGDTTETILVKEEDWYSVKVINENGCEGISKRVPILTKIKPAPEITGKKSCCTNSEAKYSIDKLSGSDIFWTISNGEFISGQGTEEINVLWSNTGLGTVKVKEENTKYCFGEDEIQVTIAESLHPEISKSHDVLCKGSEIILSTTDNYETYEWSSGETTKEITVIEPGLYWVRVADENGCEGVSDTIEIIEVENPTPEIIIDGILCEGGSTKLYTENEYEGYLWNTGETTREITINNAGNYSVIVTDKNGCEGTTNIDISEFIIELAGLQDIDFDLVDVAHSDSKNLILTNNSNKDIEINRVFFEDNNQAIFELETIPKTPLIIKENEALELMITFAPEDTIEYMENVIIEIGSPCETTKSFETKGKGYSIVQEGYEVTVWLPDTTAVIGTNDYRIPLTAKLSRDDVTLEVESYEAEIEYYADAYLPESIANAIFIDNEIDDNKRYIKLRGEGLIINGETILAELTGTVLLSELLEVPLYLKSFTWSSSIPIETVDGKLTHTGACVPAIRLVQPIEGLSVAIVPNPAEDEANISIISPVENTPVYKIFTVEGMQIHTGEIQTQKNNNSFTGTATIELTNYHSGIYLLTVQVQNIIVFEKVVVVK